MSERPAVAAHPAGPDAPTRGGARMARIFASLLSADLVTKGLAAVATIIVVRALAPAAFGDFAFALAAAAVLGVLVDFGLPILLVRDVSESPARAPALLGAALRLVSGLGVLVFGAAALLVVAAGAPGPADAATLALAFAVIGVNALLRPFESTLAGCGRAHLVTVSYSVRGVTLVGVTAAVAAAVADPGPPAFLAAALAAELVGLAVIATLCRVRCCRPSLRAPRRELVRVARRAVPFALLVGFSLLYFRIDLIMLGLMGSAVEVGNYGVAAKALETAVAVPGFFGSAFLATMAHSGTASSRAADATARALRYLLIVCVPLAFGLAVLADPLVDVLAGADYEQAGGILLRLSPVLALVAAYAVLANLQIALGRTDVVIKISLAGIAFKIALNAWAIPRYGAEGAAVAAVAGEVVVVVAQWYSARSYFDVPAVLAWCGRLALSAAAMVAVGWLIATGLAPLPALAGGLAAFALAAALTHTATAGDIRMTWASLARTS